MALRGIQEYIARDVNNIARVKDEGNIVSIEDYYSYRALCVILLSNNRG